MPDVDAILATAQRPEAPVEVYLGPPEMAHERERLEKKKGRTKAEQTRLQELNEQTARFVLKTRVRAIPHREWSALIVEHPPREGVEADRRKGVNVDSFWAAAVPPCLPDLTRDQYDKLDAAISEGEWQKVCNLVELVNTGVISVPKSLADSPTSPNSDGTSNQPNDSASA
jgi:hypothetical protein